MASGDEMMTRDEMLKRYKKYQQKSIADKLEHDQAIDEMTLEYNLSLLEGEDPISESEMAEIMEEQQIDHLEREVVYDKDVNKPYGINWKLLQESDAEIDIVRRPTKPRNFERTCE